MITRHVPVGLARGIFLGAVVVLAGAGSAGASVISGGCHATATWRATGKSYDTGALQPSEVVKIPRGGTVSWTGSLPGASPGPSHSSSGDVVLSLPIGSIAVHKWDEPFGPASDHGQITYGTYPSVVDNILVPVTGHEDDNGKTICSGRATVEFVGSTFSNPLSYGSIAGLALSGGVLLLAGRRRLLP